MTRAAAVEGPLLIAQLPPKTETTKYDLQLQAHARRRAALRCDPSGFDPQHDR